MAELAFLLSLPFVELPHPLADYVSLSVVSERGFGQFGIKTYRFLIPGVSSMESWDSPERGPEMDEVYLVTEYF